MPPHLELDEYTRYGRQMILNNFGRPAQESLRGASVCIVGAGGLGCPAIQYLAAAGVGRLGIVDGDFVDLSNLQRQVLHSETRLGQGKAESAAHFVRHLNSKVNVDVHAIRVLPSNARNILGRYDIILDCTDNSPTRYLLSDTCVILGKPLVSGAALQFDGQLCVYNYKGGPCYRCLFPRPPAPEAVGSCAENGILGTVTGVIGTLQALEAIKIITGLADSRPSLLIYSALTNPPFRSIKLRSKKADCITCGVNASEGAFIDQSDYLEFCGTVTPDYEASGAIPGQPGHRLRASALQSIIGDGNIKIIDVRPPIEYGICKLPNSTNVPLKELTANPAAYLSSSPNDKIVVVCRLGNDSQIAATALRDVSTEPSMITDLIGGLRAWSMEVNPAIPIY